MAYYRDLSVKELYRIRTLINRDIDRVKQKQARLERRLTELRQERQNIHIEVMKSMQINGQFLNLERLNEMFANNERENSDIRGRLFQFEKKLIILDFLYNYIVGNYQVDNLDDELRITLDTYASKYAF